MNASDLARDCLAARARRVARVLTAIYDRALEPQGLTAGQLNLLAAIDTAGPCPLAALGEALAMERSTVSRNLDLLRSHGLVQAASADGKGMRSVAITGRGRDRIAAAIPAWREAQREAADLLGTEGVAAVHTAAAALGRRPGDDA